MSYHTGLSRDGPALLVRDLMDGKARDDLARVAALAPDIAVLQNVDYDHDLIAVSLIQKALADLGHAMPHGFTARPNTGRDSGIDLDRNGKLGEPRDMLGYGQFAGQGGMLLLSRFPLVADGTTDLSQLLWRDAPMPDLPADEYFAAPVLDVLPLHSVGAWDVGVETPRGVLRVLTSHATTPVFDGPEDRNGLRNAAELRFWRHYIEQPQIADAPFVLLGTFNSDLDAGEGHKPPLRALLQHPLLTDPEPTWAGDKMTAHWSNGLQLRVDYVLPSRRLGVRAAKVERTPQTDSVSRHYPVIVDVVWQ
ncbi:endonuclease/exonuclease/phosphatase family protein [Litoreibacter albidus]|uniref:Metal-dependent hydrolase, endonuclease/exonuclease/phosphatase family n=1 Tax=Litoreibacter albidus TaxID=670155 RepID=A0A1H2W504_9RHOB|nr:endonuclease/exonuclease/phosphatase family protein [Litoreibacter albidus]SDW75159.1 Metal-dependent hydrolase, endonuclease/exonuclease/phosphatase family [Litoreibacter albidus]